MLNVLDINKVHNDNDWDDGDDDGGDYDDSARFQRDLTMYYELMVN